MTATATDAAVDEMHAQAARLHRIAQEIQAIAKRFDHSRCASPFRRNQQPDLNIVTDAIAQAADAASDALAEARGTALCMGVPE